MRTRPQFMAVAAAFVSLFCATLAPQTANAGDDWTTYAHDDRRTGFQPGSTGITRTTAGDLQMRWTTALRETVTASPIVAGSTVYVATENGHVFALRTDNGKVRWKQNLGASGIRMTPALVHGQLLVGVYGLYGTRARLPSGASLQALDPATGRVVWKTPLPGVVRSEPVVVKGVIYEGIAGGDPDSGCVNGRIVTLDERTGKLLSGVWYTSSKPRNGGGIWAPLSYDGERIFFGTGNTCDNLGAQDAIVAISPALETLWVTPARSPGGEDEDVGGGVMIRGDLVYCEGKDGSLFALDRRTGATKWTADVGAISAGGGGFATPAGDGTILAVNSGDGSKDPPNRTKLVAFDFGGREQYTINQQTVSSPSLGASFVLGVGFAGIDKSVVAFDAQSGVALWTYPTADAFYAVPAIATSGVYTVDLSGNVYAFGLGFGAGAPKHAAATVAPAKIEHGNRDIVVGSPTFGRRQALELAAPVGGALAAIVGIYWYARRRRRG